MPIGRQMDKHNVVFLYSNILLSNRKEWTTRRYNRGEFHTLMLSTSSQAHSDDSVCAHLYLRRLGDLQEGCTRELSA